MNTCHYCGPTDRELRPYGPGGATICFPCMTENSEREQAASQRFLSLLEANTVIGDGVVVIGEPEGPRPL